MKHALRKPQSGLTLIELMVVIALMGILLALAAPSFTDTLARKRVEGVASELSFDLQYARSEAAARNAPVRLTLGTDCYAIHLSAAAVSAACAVTPSASGIKVVRIESGTPINLSGNNSLGYVDFDPVRGTATWPVGNNTNCGFESDGSTPVVCGAMNVESTTTTSKLRVMTAFNGRVRMCSQNGSIKGYSSDNCS